MRIAERSPRRLMILEVVTFLACACMCAQAVQQKHIDRPFLQDFAEKVPLAPQVHGAKLIRVRADRNGHIAVLSDKGLLTVHDGRLTRDRLHRPLTDMQLRDLQTHRDQFVYLTSEAVLSNAWAGQLLVAHRLADANLLAMGKDFELLIVAGDRIAHFVDGRVSREWPVGRAATRQIVYDGKRRQFLLLTQNGICCLKPPAEMAKVFEGKDLQCVESAKEHDELLVGTSNGYLRLDADSFEPKSNAVVKLPSPDIRCIREIGGRVWFGTPRGAFTIHSDGRIDYYASKRWLVDDEVVDIFPGPDDSVSILTGTGLSSIHFKKMTLADKAEYFDRLTRKRHVRYGFNSAFVMSEPGDLSAGALIDQDNDGLWTAMYLAGELFRYAVTKSDEALRNCYESFEAMERLTHINPLDGFPARSFDRAGYEVADKPRWHRTDDGKWTWKGTTSSDEIVGHFFVYAIFAELAPDKAWKQRAINLMDDIMDHIVRNDFYLIDVDGKPTLWGKWNPEYVIQFPREVGDRRLNSAEIIAFLQTAFHFTHKEIYRQKAFELLKEHYYLGNIRIPISRIGRVPGIDLTTEWNHSDDELAFLSYWNLYRYALSPELREVYRQAIREHWEIERPEKNPLWNLIYASTGAEDFDLTETIWSLQQFPLDMISWTVTNSHRKDLDFLEPNFREQSTRRVLPPDERPMGKYNMNAFQLGGGNGGRREFSGDIYTLPYWMGRYLGIID